MPRSSVGGIYKLKGKSRAAISAMERGEGVKALAPSADAPSAMGMNTAEIRKALGGYKPQAVSADAKLKRMEAATIAKKAKSKALEAEMTGTTKPMASKRMNKLVGMVKGYETGRKS